MDTLANVPCFSGVLVLRRDDTVTDSSSSSEESKNEIEELLRVTVQGETVPPATDIAPFTFLDSQQKPLENSWFRSFVLTNEINKKLYGCSLTWSIRTVTEDVSSSLSKDKENDENDYTDSDSDYSDRSTSPVSVSAPTTNAGSAIHLAIVLIGKISSFFTYNRILRLLADTMEDGGDDPHCRLIRLRLASEALLSRTPYPLPGTSLKINFSTLNNHNNNDNNNSNPTDISVSTVTTPSIKQKDNCNTVTLADAPVTPLIVSKTVSVVVTSSTNPSSITYPTVSQKTLEAVVSVPYLHHHPSTIELESLYTLFRLLPIPVIISMFRCLLLETRMIIHIEEQYIGLLAPLCESILSLLYPFHWAHTYAPLLPVGLEITTLLDSPCPFFIGISTETITDIPLSTFMDTNTVVIDADNGRIHIPNETVIGTPLPSLTSSLFSRAPWFSPSSSLSSSRRLGKSSGTFFSSGTGNDTTASSSSSTNFPPLPLRLGKQLTLSLQQFTKNCYNPSQCKTELKNLSNNYNGKDGTLPIGICTFPTTVVKIDPAVTKDEEQTMVMLINNDQYRCGTYSPVQRTFSEALPIGTKNDNSVTTNNTNNLYFNHLGIQRAFLDIMLALVGDYDDHMKEIESTTTETTQTNERKEDRIPSSTQAAAYLGLKFDKVSSLQCKTDYEPFVSSLYATQGFDNFLTARLNITAWTDLSVLYFDAIIDTLITGKPSTFLQGYTNTQDPDTVSADPLLPSSLPPLSQFSKESTLALLSITCAIPSVSMVAENRNDEYTDTAYSIVPLSFYYSDIYEQTYTYVLQHYTQVNHHPYSSSSSLLTSPSLVLSPLTKLSTPSITDIVSPQRSTINLFTTTSLPTSLHHQPEEIMVSPYSSSSSTTMTTNRDLLRANRLSLVHHHHHHPIISETEKEKELSTVGDTKIYNTNIEVPGPIGNDKRGWFSRIFSTGPSITTTTTQTGITTTAINLASPHPPTLKSPFTKLQSPRTTNTNGKTYPQIISPEGLIGSPSGGNRNTLSHMHIPSSTVRNSSSNSNHHHHRKHSRSSSTATTAFLSPLPKVSTVTPVFASPLFHGQSMTVKSRRRKMLVEQNPELSVVTVSQRGEGGGINDAAETADENAYPTGTQRDGLPIETTDTVPEVPTVNFHSFVVVSPPPIETRQEPSNSRLTVPKNNKKNTVSSFEPMKEEYETQQQQQILMLQKALNQALATIEQLRNQQTNEDALIEIAVVPSVNWKYESVFDRLKKDTLLPLVVSVDENDGDRNDDKDTVIRKEINLREERLRELRIELTKANIEKKETIVTALLTQITTLDHELRYYSRLHQIDRDERNALYRIQQEYRQRNYDQEYLRRGVHIICSYHTYLRETTVPYAYSGATMRNNII